MRRCLFALLLAMGFLPVAGCGGVDNSAQQLDNVPPLPAAGPSTGGSSQPPGGPPPISP